MRIRRPGHTTVVAYIALFVALGGSAIAVTKVTTRDIKTGAVTSAKIKNANVRAEDLPDLVIREGRASVEPNDSGSATVSCNRKETLVSGAGGWETQASGAPAPVVSATSILQGREGGDPTGVIVRGASPGLPNTIVAQAVCVPN